MYGPCLEAIIQSRKARPPMEAINWMLVPEKVVHVCLAGD